KSSTRALILFISKKNNSLYLYIDFRNLNRIFIKNYYSLYLILEILNKIKFLKINTSLKLIL
ncbi:uncharacterized protein BP01DRAFT_307788, partial [Aspergillus saccharolyticus JOP 1030-1]